VCSELSDHTSQLKFLELITGVKEPNISDWRRQTVGDLTSAFRFNQPNMHPPALPDTNGQYNLAQYEIANLPMPAQPLSRLRDSAVALAYLRLPPLTCPDTKSGSPQLAGAASR
jgi:phospholipase C